MLRKNTNLLVAAFLLSTLAIAYAISAHNFAVASTEKPIKEVLIDRAVELPNKDFNILVRTVEWPVGYKSALHTHKGPGPRYVLSGNVKIDDNGKIGEYNAGESFWHPGGFPHTAENIADEPSKVLIIELLPKKLQ